MGKKLKADGFFHSAKPCRYTRNIQRRWGNDGYAAYYKILETISAEPNYSLDLSTWYSIKDLADDCRVPENVLSEVIEFCCEYGLLDKQEWDSSRVLKTPENIYIRESHVNSLTRQLVISEYKKHQRLVFDRDGHRCVYCGSTEDLSLDHVTALSCGGSNEPDNLATCCRSCNSKKSDKSVSEWLGGES